MTARSFTKLEYLAAWKKRPLVDRLIDNGLSGYYVSKWINENGLSISMPSVYKYISKRTEATKRGIPIEKLLSDERRSRSHLKKPKVVREIEKGKDPRKRKQPFNNPTDQDRQKKRFSINHITNDIDVLDVMLDKEYRSLKKGNDLTPEKTKMLLEIINTKYKLTGGEHKGLTIYGIEEVRLKQKALENAVIDILKSYVPEEKYDEVLVKIQNEMSKFINQLDKLDNKKTGS